MNKIPCPTIPRRILAALSALLLGLLCLTIPEARAEMPASNGRTETLMTKTRQKIEQELSQKGFVIGQPIFVRIFKIPGLLELWIDKGQGYALFKTYNICTYSGFPGPKLSEGDWQSPEGFYQVSARQMNPNSQYHLAFDIGYPNEYDAYRNRTGSLIMVHGDCMSVGCFAMGDHRIEEIYLLAHAALLRGQEKFSVHIFPFPLTAENFTKFASSPWISFWKTLETGFTAFEQSRHVPEIQVQNGNYVVSTSGRLAMNKAAQDPVK